MEGYPWHDLRRLNRNETISESHKEHGDVLKCGVKTHARTLNPKK